MGPYASLWVFMCRYWSLCVLIGLDVFSFFLMPPYRSLKNLMRLYGFLWVLTGSYSSLCVLTGPYKFLCVLMGPCVSLLVHVCPYGSS